MESAVVDANVFIHGRGSYPFKKAITSQKVINEVQSDHGKNMLQNMDFEIKTPSETSLEQVRDKSEDVNSPTSDTDEVLLALALELDETLLTDDIALQNLALHMDVDFEGFLEDQIEDEFRWKVICRNCGSEVFGEGCSSCGSTDLRRKQVRCS